MLYWRLSGVAEFINNRHHNFISKIMKISQATKNEIISDELYGAIELKRKRIKVVYLFL